MNKWIKKLLTETKMSHDHLLEAWAIVKLSLSQKLGLDSEDFGDDENRIIYRALKERFCISPAVDVLIDSRADSGEFIKGLTKAIKEKKTAGITMGANRDKLRAEISRKAKALREEGDGGGGGISGMGAVGTPSDVIMAGPAPVSMRGGKKKKAAKKAKAAKKGNGKIKNMGKTWTQHIAGLPKVENFHGCDMLKNALSTDAFVNEMLKRG